MSTEQKKYYDEDRSASEKREQKQTWVIAAVLGAAILISLIFLVYAFIQKTEADRQRAINYGLEVQLRLCREGK